MAMDVVDGMLRGIASPIVVAAIAVCVVWMMVGSVAIVVAASATIVDARIATIIIAMVAMLGCIVIHMVDHVHYVRSIHISWAWESFRSSPTCDVLYRNRQVQLELILMTKDFFPSTYITLSWQCIKDPDIIKDLKGDN